MAALAGQGVTATCSWPDGPRYGALDLDSNLPDVRIALGGPEHNPWTARLLEAVNPSGAEFSRARAGGLPLWLPAAQSRAAAFAPGADVRGARDLPVLMVAGPDLAASVAAVAADLADSEISVTPLGDDAGSRLAGALGGAAQPGHAEQPGHPGRNAAHRADAVVQRVAVRGVDRRRPADAPDGSSFAWQHWSHAFEYALAAGAGDWRWGGFAPAGQEYNHPLLVTETGCSRPAARRGQPVPGQRAGHAGRAEAAGQPAGGRPRRHAGPGRRGDRPAARPGRPGPGPPG